jgi:ABC-2 type transport system permease protein
MTLVIYWALACLALRRQLAYRTANIAGLLANGFFGVLRASIFLAVFASAPAGAAIAGYDVAAMVTYMWGVQALIMIVRLWGWWEVEESIRSGDVVTDLARPISYLGYWLARELGGTAYFVVFRAVPTLLVAQLTFGDRLRLPAEPAAWLAVGASVLLAVLVAFGWRFLVNLSAFWTTDARGLGHLSNGVVLFLGGFVIPLRFFPDWAQPIVLALPFAAMIQIPTDVFVGRLPDIELGSALVRQAAWAVALLAACQMLIVLAMRRVTIQGG